MGRRNLVKFRPCAREGEKILSYLTSWEELRQDDQLPKYSTKEEQIQKK